jgi:hypothetical protein
MTAGTEDEQGALRHGRIVPARGVGRLSSCSRSRLR